MCDTARRSDDTFPVRASHHARQLLKPNDAPPWLTCPPPRVIDARATDCDLQRASTHTKEACLIRLTLRVASSAFARRDHTSDPHDAHPADSPRRSM